MLASVADLGDSFELRAQGSNLTDQIGLTEGEARVTPSGIINGVERGRPISVTVSTPILRQNAGADLQVDTFRRPLE